MDGGRFTGTRTVSASSVLTTKHTKSTKSLDFFAFFVAFGFKNLISSPLQANSRRDVDRLTGKCVVSEVTGEEVVVVVEQVFGVHCPVPARRAIPDGAGKDRVVVQALCIRVVAELSGEVAESEPGVEPTPEILAQPDIDVVLRREPRRLAVQAIARVLELRHRQTIVEDEERVAAEIRVDVHVKALGDLLADLDEADGRLLDGDVVAHQVVDGGRCIDPATPSLPAVPHLVVARRTRLELRSIRGDRIDRRERTGR